jgi:hypothetical protein
VWLGVRTAIGQFVVTKTGTDYGQRIVIQETALRRGMPVHLPAGDDGHAAITFDDVAADRFDKLQSASKAAGAWLSGVLAITESGYWDITWRLHWNGRVREWTKPGVSFDAAIKDGLETSALIFSGNLGM